MAKHGDHAKVAEQNEALLTLLTTAFPNLMQYVSTDDTNNLFVNNILTIRSPRKLQNESDLEFSFKQNAFAEELEILNAAMKDVKGFGQKPIGFNFNTPQTLEKLVAFLEKRILTRAENEVKERTAALQEQLHEIDETLDKRTLNRTVKQSEKDWEKIIGGDRKEFENLDKALCVFNPKVSLGKVLTQFEWTKNELFEQAYKDAGLKK